jgi:chaperone BCS1
MEIFERNPYFSGGLTLMVIGSATGFLRRLPGRIWAFVERRLSISVEIPDRDPAFRWVETWLAAHRHARRVRDLTLTTTWVHAEADPTINGDPYYDSPSGPASQAKFLLAPAPGVHLLSYRGRLLFLYRNRRELQHGGSSAFQEILTLQLLFGSRRHIEDLCREAHEISFPKSPGVNILTACQDSWVSTSWQPRRPLESLVLADHLLEDMLGDLRDFLGSSKWYTQRGIPYRRGYLLHGPPGTGKTTLVAATAGELKLSVAVLSLSSRSMSDEQLRALVDALPVATILLIEDVDCVFKEKRGTNDATGVTLSGLLNALDGVSSREGRLLFLTTNHPEKLDPALIRPGRVDRKVELGYATPDQARRLFLWFYRDSGLAVEKLNREAELFAGQVPTGKLSMAAIQEHLLRHRRNPEAAAHEVVFEESVSEQRADPVPASASYGAPAARVNREAQLA